MKLLLTILRPFRLSVPGIKALIFSTSATGPIINEVPVSATALQPLRQPTSLLFTDSLLIKKKIKKKNRIGVDLLNF